MYNRGSEDEGPLLIAIKGVGFNYGNCTTFLVHIESILHTHSCGPTCLKVENEPGLRPG